MTSMYKCQKHSNARVGLKFMPATLNNVRLLQFKAQSTNVFFDGRSQLPTTSEHAVFNTVQTTQSEDGRSRRTFDCQ